METDELRNDFFVRVFSGVCERPVLLPTLKPVVYRKPRSKWVPVSHFSDDVPTTDALLRFLQELFLFIAIGAMVSVMSFNIFT
jgi:hypothetical protein